MPRPSKHERRPGRPPGSTSDATRARILSAARECFARTGYAGTTNKQIAEGAGITAAAIYQYFDSKTALFMATVHDAQAEMLPEFRAAVDAEPTARGALRALLLTSARLSARDPSLSAFLSALPIEMRREEDVARAMAEAPSEVLGLIEEIAARGVRTGELDEDAAGHVVSMLIACMMGLSLYAATIDAAEHARAVDAFVALVDGKLFARRARR